MQGLHHRVFQARPTASGRVGIALHFLQRLRQCRQQVAGGKATAFYQFDQLLIGNAQPFGGQSQCARQGLAQLTAQLFHRHGAFAGHLAQCQQGVAHAFGAQAQRGPGLCDGSKQLVADFQRDVCRLGRSRKAHELVGQTPKLHTGLVGRFAQEGDLGAGGAAAFVDRVQALGQALRLNVAGNKFAAQLDHLANQHGDAIGQQIAAENLAQRAAHGICHTVGHCQLAVEPAQLTLQRLDAHLAGLHALCEGTTCNARGSLQRLHGRAHLGNLCLHLLGAAHAQRAEGALHISRLPHFLRQFCNRRMGLIHAGLHTHVGGRQLVGVDASITQRLAQALQLDLCILPPLFRVIDGGAGLVEFFSLTCRRFFNGGHFSGQHLHHKRGLFILCGKQGRGILLRPKLIDKLLLLCQLAQIRVECIGALPEFSSLHAGLFHAVDELVQ